MFQKIRQRLFPPLAWILVFSLLQATALAAGITADVVMGTGIPEAPAAEVSAVWDPAWFTEDASVYQQELALTSMALSGAAYAVEDGSPCIQSALTAFGFTDIQSYNYHIPTTAGSKAAYTFGMQTVRARTGEPVRLAAVVIRGTGEYTEWASNLNVGTGSSHEGFRRAASELLENLRAYLDQQAIPAEESVKFLVTGHSRGGAIANLLAARLLEEGLAAKDGLYCYTFAAPAVSTTAAEEGYENIFNIINEDDLVPQVPLAAWGYRRYGVDLPVGSSAGDAKRFERMNRQYKSLSGQDYVLYQGTAPVKRITGAIQLLIPSTSGINLELLTAILSGDLQALSLLMKEDSAAALTLGKTALELSALLTPLLQQEQAGLRSAHCMAGYYSWLSSLADEPLKKGLS